MGTLGYVTDEHLKYNVYLIKIQFFGRRRFLYVFILQIGCQWNDLFTSKEIFLVAALIGFGGAAMLIISLSLTADLVGQDTESSAFIYGAISLLDKLSNGMHTQLMIE